MHRDGLSWEAADLGMDPCAVSHRLGSLSIGRMSIDLRYLARPRDKHEPFDLQFNHMLLLQRTRTNDGQKGYRAADPLARKIYVVHQML
jgi:hypothetical protein